MGRTMTLEEVEDLSVRDLLQKIALRHEPLTVILEEGQTVTLIKDYSIKLPTTQTELKLEPLMTLPGFVPEGWKDAVYGEDGSGSA